MPKRSLVDGLPEEIRAELDKRLIAGGFKAYQELADWLSDLGYKISKSSIHRHGKKFEEQLADLKRATEQAKAIAETVGDDANHLGDALTRLAQHKAFQLLSNLDFESQEISLDKLGNMIAHLNKAAISQKKWAVEIQEKLNQKLTKLESEGSKGKLDSDTLRRVREEIYGIFS